MSSNPVLRAILGACLLVALVGLLPPAAVRAEPADFDLPDGSGHFYRQANGRNGEGETGFAITNADGISFWNEYQRLGGPEVLGYPVSRRFVWDGFTVQVMQKVVLQWRPEVAQVYFVNVFDRMHDLGKDGWLEVVRATPAPLAFSEAGLSWDAITKTRWSLLDVDPAIKAAYWADADPLQHFGLPVSHKDYGNVSVVRAQRAVFQRWKEDVPWARKGQVTVANGGDIAKEAGLFPGAVITPELPPRSVQPVSPACSVVPVRGFGTVWGDHPEVYDLLGCPSWPTQEMSTALVVQRFEYGWMLWVANATAGPGARPSPQIYVLFEDNGSFVTFPDDWSAGSDPVSTGQQAPDGRYEPLRGFGKVWREGTGARTRERLGWATEPERSGTGSWQMFQRGRMVWTPDPRLVFVLAEHTPQYEVLNAWRVYLDRFPG